MSWIDTHAHLDDARFADLPEVLRRSSAAGVASILTIGIDLATSRAAVHLADMHANLFAVVGIQPNHVAEAAASDFADIEALAAHPKVVAIGESGLDKYWDRAPFPLQQDYFRRHLALARRLRKPIVIHGRSAEPDCVELMTADFAEHGPVAGVMHSYTGDTATALASIDLGLHISFAGMLTYKTAESLRETASRIPADRVLVETDAPYLAPVPHRGKRNEPAFVVETAAVLAQCLKIDLSSLAEMTTANARRLFSL